MIYYLAQAYSNNPTQAYHDAVYWVNMLREKCKVAVFSPILHTHHYHLDSPEILAEFEDYVAWDLALLSAMCINLKDICELCYDPAFFCNTCKKTKYQPNITLLFAPTCFSFLAFKMLETKWASKGAEREYEFAKEHHIRCLLLEPFLKGEEVEI